MVVSVESCLAQLAKHDIRAAVLVSVLKSGPKLDTVRSIHGDRVGSGPVSKCLRYAIYIQEPINR